tara:strand:+ start:1466 stop:2830 length:1365 start_codon:yes stop_codon:yes gene_type:complete
MAQQTLNIGSNANDGTGDNLRAAMTKVNENFTEVYSAPGFTVDTISFTGNEISALRSNDDLVFKPSGTGSVSFPAIKIDDNNIVGTRSNDDINLIPSGTGSVVFGSIKINGTSLSSDDSTAININDGLIVDGTINVSGTSTLTGAAALGSTLAVPSGLTTLSSLNVTGASSLTGTTTIDNMTFNDNTIGTSSNADLNLTPGGTGNVVISNLTVDSNINITDNKITTTQSNSDLVIAPSGTGQVVMSKADINGGTIDNTVIGGSTPLAGSFTSLSTTASLTIDGITISDNIVATNASNANLELRGNGTGGVRISGFTFPTSDGSAGQFITTNGLGVLSFATAGASLSHSGIADATTTVASSATSVLNTFDKTVVRSAKYFISMSDTTNSRFEIVEANVTHDGSDAYIVAFGSTTDHTGPLTTFTADVSGDDVRVLVTNTSDDSLVFKFQRIVINI